MLKAVVTNCVGSCVSQFCRLGATTPRFTFPRLFCGARCGTQVIYPFIDRATKDKFCFLGGNIRAAAAQATLAKNFDLDELEEVSTGSPCNVCLFHPCWRDRACVPLFSKFKWCYQGFSGRESLSESTFFFVLICFSGRVRVVGCMHQDKTPRAVLW